MADKARKLYQAQFRFYGELADFLAAEDKQRSLTYHFDVAPSVKDAIESWRVPHVEIGLILINHQAQGFDCPVRHNDRVAVYPPFRQLDISELAPIQARPGCPPAFIADAHLGKLTHYLRLMGYDTVYYRNISDSSIVDLARTSKRYVLSRDRLLLQNNNIQLGYFVRHQKPARQLRELVQRFDLMEFAKPFTLCPLCNGTLQVIEKTKAKDKVAPAIYRRFDSFYQCRHCEHIYWQGSHYDNIWAWLRKLFKQ